MKDAHFYLIKGDADVTRNFLNLRQAEELNGDPDENSDSTIVYAVWSNEYWTIPTDAVVDTITMIMSTPTPIYCQTSSQKFIEQYPINQINVTYQTL